MAVVWNLSFFKTLGEASISAGAATFASAWGVNGKFDLHDLYVALGAAGVIVLYTFAKGLGVSQAVSAGDVWRLSQRPLIQPGCTRRAV